MKRHIAVFLLLCGLLHAEALRPTCYRDNDKNVVVCSEKKLGRLMWQDEKQNFKGTWEQAQEYCKIVNLAGYKDWRLPTGTELLSITDEVRSNLALNTAFRYIADSGYILYWSQTKDARGSPNAWYVDFRNGGGSWNSGPLFVRCVRQY
ncbi:Lcl C-terminal domain-containing protein [Campylobacter concisus]